MPILHEAQLKRRHGERRDNPSPQLSHPHAMHCRNCGSLMNGTECQSEFKYLMSGPREPIKDRLQKSCRIWALMKKKDRRINLEKLLGGRRSPEPWVWGPWQRGTTAGPEEADKDLEVVCDPHNMQKDSSSTTPTPPGGQPSPPRRSSCMERAKDRSGSKPQRRATREPQRSPRTCSLMA